jgi:uncharacterized membrane protein YhiD involved in acid resistance
VRELFASAYGETLFTGAPLSVLLRIIAAVLLGGAVAWIHARSTSGNRESRIALQATLVLLAGLIAMVTQVIGDNVARAFSLVGALSIVRFRTVVRDTRDTAFVIFAVAVGMAVGAQAPWAAISGIVVLGATALVLSKREGAMNTGAEEDEGYRLIVRTSADFDFEQTAGAIADKHLDNRRIASLRTAKQGACVDHAFSATLRKEADVPELIRVLNRIEGVQEVKLLRHDVPEESSK